jgi:hypothetical protein
MTSFSKTFVTTEGPLTLSFRKVENFTSKKYFVVAHNSHSRVAAFEIKENSKSEWKVLQPAPLCMIQLEQKLAAAIEEHNKQLVH